MTIKYCCHGTAQKVELSCDCKLYFVYTLGVWRNEWEYDFNSTIFIEIEYWNYIKEERQDHKIDIHSDTLGFIRRMYTTQQPLSD